MVSRLCRLFQFLPAGMFLLLSIALPSLVFACLYMGFILCLFFVGVSCRQRQHVDRVVSCVRLLSFCYCEWRLFGREPSTPCLPVNCSRCSLSMRIVLVFHGQVCVSLPHSAFVNLISVCSCPKLMPVLSLNIGKLCIPTMLVGLLNCRIGLAGSRIIGWGTSIFVMRTIPTHSNTSPISDNQNWVRASNQPFIFPLCMLVSSALPPSCLSVLSPPQTACIILCEGRAPCVAQAWRTTTSLPPCYPRHVYAGATSRRNVYKVGAARGMRRSPCAHGEIRLRT